ncbi:MAG: MdtA/MuxA family multidrug efflux RND transporter periplasmic adaptor subunit [Sulfurospirillaceae bacterium]|nr:MdtA/MuxA family multidrug efflux RND transporter periplasmic adaptor subunit [Sulfurospirillaceae bacterium]MDD2826655.1 MdtA/MuxA family multidrug efflux RND transporter periplasmic adaptor subunit [Sulfurospirillaceae bacterium]
MLSDEKTTQPSTPSLAQAPKGCCSPFFIIKVIVILFMIGGGYWLYTNKSSTTTNPSVEKSRMSRTSSVVTAKVTQGDVPIYLKGLGTVAPLATVTIKSRIDGQLMNILYTEGQLVKKGDILAQIDVRPYTILLAQAEGQKLKDQALLDNALIDLKRYQDLLAQDSISKQIVDTQIALVNQYRGTLQIDTASIENTKLQIEYCTIKAPMSGRVGLQTVDVGNMIRTSDASGIAVITQTEPIVALFSIPEDTISPVLQKLYTHAKLPVDAYDRADKMKLSSGQLISADNQIDSTTGTLKLKAQFDNHNQTLFPNQFVNIHLLVDTQHDAFLIPTAAVQHGVPGTFVYKLKEDSTVTVAIIKTGAIVKDHIVVESGITLNDTVVVDGVDKLREGAKVTVISKDSSGGKKAGVSKNASKSDAQP